ncbi:MAG: histidinol dehydrogenase [Ancrocorticia sp.]|uniref:histidinol dehydrogenase n=1 Tax=Ancrocorticia sp. TaxID=2593684 RepID=UPI003F92E73C
MLQRIDLRGVAISRSVLADKLPRAAFNIEKALEVVGPLIDDVRERGGAALRDASEKFDKVRPAALRVPAEELEKAAGSLDPALTEALKISIAHNRVGHTAQLPEEKLTEVMSGGFVRQRWIPVQRVGLYVPGGLAVYPSSVIMNAVAAQVAGVKEIALASPAQAEFGGLPHPTILAACHLLGITEVYAVGGASAIGMFAYGAAGEPNTADPEVLCEPVDVVTGPGNIYVAAAKRLVRGTVGIDAEAGTTEIAVLADDTANPEHVAADLLSQAEHDPAAASVLITDSDEFANRVDAALERRAGATKHRERVRTALTGPQSGVVLVDDMDTGVRVANAYGAEHLEIQTEKAPHHAGLIHNAGAIFVGPYNPVPLGDYIAGSNHVLPTGGTAAFNSGLNVHAFIKSVQSIEYSAEAMAKVYPHLRVMALDEDLPAHAEALEARLEDEA